MPNKKRPMDFIAQSQADPKLSAKILGAVEKGGLVTARAVMKMAQSAGYRFSRTQFEAAMRRDIRARFKAGERGLAATINAADSPESSCAKGCLSHTTSWHPDPPEKFGPAIRPVRSSRRG